MDQATHRISGYRKILGMGSMPTHQKNTDRLSRTAFFRHLLRPSAMVLFILCISVSMTRADDRMVRIGIYENAPKVFMDESGKPSGIFVDIIEHIAKIEGWKLEYVAG